MKLKPLAPICVIPMTPGVVLLVVLETRLSVWAAGAVEFKVSVMGTPLCWNVCSTLLHDNIVEGGHLLSGRLTAEEARDLRAVIPGLGVAGRDGTLQRVGA